MLHSTKDRKKDLLFPFLKHRLWVVWKITFSGFWWASVFQQMWSDDFTPGNWGNWDWEQLLSASLLSRRMTQGRQQNSSLLEASSVVQTTQQTIIPVEWCFFISSTTSIHQLGFSQFLPVRRLPDLLLAIVVLLKRLLQFGGDLLEEVDLLAEVVLHLGAEVPYPCAVEMLDLRQRGAGNDVAALMELALLLWTVLHLGEGTWRRANRAESPFDLIKLKLIKQVSKFRRWWSR